MLDWDRMGVMIECIQCTVIHSRQWSILWAQTFGNQGARSKSRRLEAQGYRRNYGTSVTVPIPLVDPHRAWTPTTYRTTSSLNSRRLDLDKESVTLKRQLHLGPAPQLTPLEPTPNLGTHIASWNRDTRSVSAYPRSSRLRPATASTGVESRTLSRSAGGREEDHGIIGRRTGLHRVLAEVFTSQYWYWYPGRATCWLLTTLGLVLHRALLCRASPYRCEYHHHHHLEISLPHPRLGLSLPRPQ